MIDPRRTPLARHRRPASAGPARHRPAGRARADSRAVRARPRRPSVPRDARDRRRRTSRARPTPWTIERAADGGRRAGRTTSRTLADWYGTTSPAVIRCGWGQERNRNGGSATLAILALPAVAGKFGVRGGGYTMSNSAAWGITAERSDRRARAADAHRQHESARPGADRVSAIRRSPCCSSTTAIRSRRCPIRIASAAGSSARICSRSSFEQVMTDTARVRRPAAAGDDVSRALRHREGLRRVSPAARAAGDRAGRRGAPESRGVPRARRAPGLHEPWTPTTSSAKPARCWRRPRGCPSALRAGDARRRAAAAAARRRPADPVRRRAARRRRTASAHSVPARRSTRRTASTPTSPTRRPTRYPLSLISPASEHTISSTLGEFRPGIARLQDPSRRRPHADDRRRRHGARVQRTGRRALQATVTPEMRPGTVSLPKGLWARSTFNGSTANALVPDTLTDMAAARASTTRRVQVEVLGRH